jgi:hypothetical protein
MQELNPVFHYLSFYHACKFKAKLIKIIYFTMNVAVHVFGLMSANLNFFFCSVNLSGIYLFRYIVCINKIPSDSFRPF